MLPSGVPMNRKIFVLAAIPAALLFLAACGDGPASAKETPTPKPSPTSAVPADGFGPAPVLGGNIVKVSPEHAAHVTRASTITTNPLSPKGVCVDVTFD